MVMEDNIEKYEIVELFNGSKYAIIDRFDYDGKQYVLANEITQNELELIGEEKIFIYESNDQGYFLKIIEGNDEYNKASNVFDERAKLLQDI